MRCLRAAVLPMCVVQKCEHWVHWSLFGEREVVTGRARVSAGCTTLFGKVPHATFLVENNADGLLSVCGFGRCGLLFCRRWSPAVLFPAIV